MDTGEGRFEQVDLNMDEVCEIFKYQKNPEAFQLASQKIAELRKKYPKSKGIFTVGEELEIKGSRFQVKDISPFGIKLKLLPQA